MLQMRCIGTCRAGQRASTSLSYPRHTDVTQHRIVASTSAVALSSPTRLNSRVAHNLRTAQGRSGSSNVRVAGAVKEDALNLPLDRDLEEPLSGFSKISDALAALAAGEFLVVIDDENRENEGDLIIAADRVTTEAMAFMVEYTSGVICIGMEGKDLDRLRLPLMVSSLENEEAMYTAFTITVDLRDGITTGISAADRANTLRALADPAATPQQFRRPGHIFPLRYRPGGVLVRPGHTEASVDLARLAGCYPAGALCEIVNKPDGSMSRTPELLQFAKEHKLHCITIADLMRYRLRHEQLVSHDSTAVLKTRHGRLQVHTFTSQLDGSEHIAVVAGDVARQDNVLVHVQRDSSVADLLGCAPGQPSGAVCTEDMLQHIASHAPAVLVYMRNQGVDSRGPKSLAEELKHLSAAQSAAGAAPAPGQESGALDLQSYAMATQMLGLLQVRSVVLASDDSSQHMALKSCGMKVNGIAAAGAPLDVHAMNGQSNVHVGSVHAHA